MSRTARIIVGMVVLVLALLLVGLVYVWQSGGSGEASGTITAPTLERPTQEASPQSGSTEGSDPDTEAGAASDRVVFSIVPGESEVRFILDEDLRGARNTVRGITDQIAGQIAVDFANPEASEVGEIRVNARTLATDNEFRNRAIRGQILQSAQDEFEFITFVPTALEGLPATVTLDEPIEFQIIGSLTIRDVTQPVTFAVTVTLVSDTHIEGSANATVQREDYGLTIPSVPGVANVSEAVRLEIDFVATAATPSQ